MKSRSRWWSVLLYVGVGGVSGAVLGYVQQCAGGTCPLTCAWWRGALFGAVAGLLVWASGRITTRPSPSPPDTTRKSDEQGTPS